MEQPDSDKPLTKAELEQMLQEMDNEIATCWARVMELRQKRPALVARIIDKQRETNFLRSI